ncbi:MAG: DsrE family protein [Alphaproteobacteria bacterium]|nr:DsrE family protein [Alphaproteobacteria bacterium]
MAADAPALSIIALSGDYEHVHYALAMASAARAVGRPVTLFFTQGALHALTRDAQGRGGWQTIPGDSQAIDDLAATRGLGNAGGGASRDAQFKERRIGDFETLLAACVELGVRFIVCEMGLRAQGIDPKTLRRDVPFETAGIVTLLDATPAGAHIVTL